MLEVFSALFNRKGDEAALLDADHPLLKRLLEGEPLEYLLSEAFFYTSRFYVNPHVLIPRNETEILVELAINAIETKNYASFADVGVGSGCVALSILANCSRDLKGYATDVSLEALKVCDINLFRHGSRIPANSSLEILHGDRLEPVAGKVDLVVSNPPYIDSLADQKHVHFQADRYEPHEALYLAGESYETWFEEFFASASEKLAAEGALLMEGHENKLQGLARMARARFAEVEVLKDYAGADRFLRAYK